MKIICSCGKELTESTIGVNGSDYYECKCGLTYNVYVDKIKE